MITNYMGASTVPAAGQDVMEWLRSIGAPGTMPGMGAMSDAERQALAARVGATGVMPPGVGAMTEAEMRAMREQAMNAQGWDGVNAKMQYMAQQARARRLHPVSQPVQPGVGGGGGGFGQLLHSLFGRGAPQ